MGDYGECPFCPLMSASDKESSNVLAMADARAVAVAESAATLERNVSMFCSGTENLNVWTRGVLVGGGVATSLVKPEY